MLHPADGLHDAQPLLRRALLVYRGVSVTGAELRVVASLLRADPKAEIAAARGGQAAPAAANIRAVDPARNLFLWPSCVPL